MKNLKVEKVIKNECSHYKWLLRLGIFSLFISTTSAQDLKSLFQNPPPEARPRTWMHVMSGNMSKVGMTKDLEAMADAGLGGIILFNVTVGTPKKGETIFNSPDHIDKIAHTAAECERLGLSFGVHNCDGWTSSGGPWITPEHSMKQIVHREVVVDGGNVNIKLPEPTRRGDYYEDVAVLAYPSLPSEILEANAKPKVTSSSKELNLELILDGKIDEKDMFEVPENEIGYIQWEYKEPHSMRSFYLNCEKSRDKGIAKLQISDDGVNFKDVIDFEVLRQGKSEYAIYKHFDAVTAKFFRFATDMDFNLSEVNLSGVYRYNDMLARTSLYLQETHRLPAIDEAPQDMIVQKEDIIDLTGKVNSEGYLNANLPKGKWTVLRFGYTITGAKNGPASPDGRGWEVDKMNRESFKVFYEGYVRNVIDASKEVAPNALQYIEIDSYEVGGQNWTKDYETSFKQEYDYDILDYLPLYAGRYIDSPETTERILWDVRDFNSKLMTDNYFDYFTELCHEDGLISYVEPYSFNAAYNELDATRKVDVVMGEFWMRGYGEMIVASSGARIYGKNIVSAEAFTALPHINWTGHPGSMKLAGDKAWTQGINEFFFHRYTHQPNTHVLPGLTMHQWGSHIDRTQTWWEGAGKDWFKYLARGQYMLRQGIPVSNVLAFVGDGAPNSILERYQLSNSLPNHINYDCINADALLNRISAKDGKLMLPNGIEYSALFIAPIEQINISTLRKIAEIAENGVLIIGEKPKVLGGFTPSEADKKEFELLVDKVWNKPTTQSKANWDELFSKHQIPIDLKIEGGEDINYIHRKTAKEDIYFFYNPKETEQTFDCTFNVDGKIPEFWNQMTGKITKLGAFENVDGQTHAAVTLPSLGSGFIVFRESAKGVQSIAPGFACNNTDLRFALDEGNRLQVASSDNQTTELEFADGTKRSINIAKIPDAFAIKNAWNVHFPDTKSGGTTVVMDNLKDWTEHEDEEIKYYSGSADYKTSFVLDSDMVKDNILCTLDLGEVNVAARVIVNDTDFGVVWMAPHVLDISAAIRKGKNTLQVEVTNQWTNRLIGDENFPDETGYFTDKSRDMPEWFLNNEPAPLKKRSTFTTYKFYNKGDELLPAGLVGPVELRFDRIMKIKKNR
ncbi:MAG: glycosyl hydrolase [Leeuwenhoekiella sp.]